MRCMLVSQASLFWKTTWRAGVSAVSVQLYGGVAGRVDVTLEGSVPSLPQPAGSDLPPPIHHPLPQVGIARNTASGGPRPLNADTVDNVD